MPLRFLSAVLTGMFCAVFAGIISTATEALTLVQVMMIGGLSGFCGSVFASLCLRGR
ncbi:MAG: hypothetical protein GDA52_08650 [Rhodobacteraceae bacterium]|nr:hypothetical protein [Paracoccaceae bacterium]